MKICHIITRTVRGGAQILLISIVKEQIRRGYDVAIISGTETGAEGSMVDEFKGCGAKIFFVPELVRKEAPLNDIKAFFKILKIITKSHFEIVHTHTSKAGVIGRITAKIAGVPCIVHSSHGHIFGKESNIPDVSDRPLMLKVFFCVEKFSSLFCDKIITLTEIEKTELISENLAGEKKFFALPNAIQLDLYTKDSFESEIAKKELGLNSDEIVITSIGRLTAEKGHSFLLDALGCLSNSLSNIKVLLVGDGPLRNSLMKKAQDMNISDKMRFLGFRDDIVRILSATDIYVHPSRYEGFGISLLEAMALKKPVIATRVGGIPEIIDDGVQGFLVSPDSQSELAEKIFTLALNKNLATTLGENGFLKVHSYYSFDKMFERLENLYKSILSRKSQFFT